MQEAEHAYRQSSEKLDLVRLSLNQHRAQATFLESKMGIFNEILGGLHQQSTPNLEAIFHWVEKQKARALADLLQNHTPKQSDNDAINQLLAEREALATQLDQHWTEFSGQNGNAYDLLGQKRSTAIINHDSHEKTQLNQLQKQLQAIDEKINLHQSPQLKWRKGHTIPIEEIQQNLDKQTLLISYYSNGQELHALTLTNKPDDIKTTSLGIDLDDVLQTWQQSRRRILRPKSALRDVQRRLNQFWEWLMQPLHAQLDKKKKLIIIPQDGLFHIPFTGLYDQKTKQYLIERWQVQIVPSATIGHHCAQHHSPTTPPLLIGNPGQIGAPDYLPGVLAEIDTIQQHVANAETLLGEKATYDAVLNLAQDRSLIHLAGHIFYDGQYPLQSGMPLANGRWLRAADLYHLYDYFRGATIVLSGCESGRIQTQGGDILGLSSAFLFAGASNLISGLWKIDDQATAQLMGNFYEHIQNGVSITHALQQAQIQHIQNPQFKHPYYWAAIQVTGNG